VVAVDLVAGAGEVTYVVPPPPPPETVRGSARCAQEVAVGQRIPSCVQDAISAQFDAAVAEEKAAETIAQSDRSVDRRIVFMSDRDGDYEIRRETECCDGWSRKHRQMDGDHALRSHRAA